MNTEEIAKNGIEFSYCEKKENTLQEVENSQIVEYLRKTNEINEDVIY